MKKVRATKKVKRRVRVRKKDTQKPKSRNNYASKKIKKRYT